MINTDDIVVEAAKHIILINLLIRAIKNKEYDEVCKFLEKIEKNTTLGITKIMAKAASDNSSSKDPDEKREIYKFYKDCYKQHLEDESSLPKEIFTKGQWEELFNAAAVNFDSDVVELLIEYGGNLNFIDDESLGDILSNNFKKFASVLKERPKSEKQILWQRLFNYAIKDFSDHDYNDFDKLKILIKYIENINDVDINCSEVLKHACFEQDYEAVKIYHSS